MERFAFAFEDRFRPLLLLVGATPQRSEVVVTDDRLVARFGRFTADTPMSNVRATEITGPYQWFKVIGVRGSLADGGATFGSSTRAGVCIRFHAPITALAGRLLQHPGLTVTVEDVEGLKRAIDARIAG